MKYINKILFICLLINLLSISLLKGEVTKNWPREITSDEGKITIFQPEIESFSDNKMECRSAVVVKIDDESSHIYGAIWYECRLATDRNNRTVTLLDLTVTADKFLGIEEDKVEKINSYLEQKMSQWEIVMSLDEILTGLEFNELINSASEKLNNEAPEIIFSTTPAALVLIDDEPIWKQIEKTKFDYVANTPFLIAKDTETGINYLKGGDNWYSSNNIYSGWEITRDVSPQMENIFGEINEETEVQRANAVPSKIIVRTTPAELILSNGEPQYSSVENTSLLFMTNTDDDILMDINTQEYYILISGRWYKSKKLNSDNWIFVAPDNLPKDFSNIPEDSPINNVRVSVSGTQEAKEAILENRIPQTAEIDRKTATLEVFYDGDPIFENIEGTDIMYAVNTDKDVLLFNNIYYCCDNAVWFESNSALGLWHAAIEIPEEFKEIPPEYPVYNVKYVFIYDYTDEFVHSGYMQGYVQNYIYHGSVFYGTGYHYTAWHNNNYYSRPLTYGFNAHYNSYSGWGFSYGASYRGYRWIDYDSRFNSKLKGYWGPSGYRDEYYRRVVLGKKRGFSDKRPEVPKNNKKERNSPNNLKTRTIATNNVYTKRDNGVSRTGNYRFNPKTGKQLFDNSSTVKRAPTATRANNLYSDKNGNVYQRKNNGKWKTRKNISKTDNKKKTTKATNTKVSTRVQKKNNKTTNQKTSSKKTTLSGNTKQKNTTKTNLNRQYEARNKSVAKTTKYNKKKTQNQYTKPNARTTTVKKNTNTKMKTNTKKKSTSGQNRSSTKSTKTRKK